MAAASNSPRRPAFRAGKELDMKAPVWHKGFSEVRIVDSSAYAKVRDYIRNNPEDSTMAGDSSDCSGL